MEFQHRGEGRSFSWKSAFFTFNEVRRKKAEDAHVCMLCSSSHNNTHPPSLQITCSILLHEAPGKDPLKVYEVSGVINKRDRMFKRKNRIDVVCIGAGILSMSAPTKEVKAQFLEKLEAR